MHFSEQNYTFTMIMKAIAVTILCLYFTILGFMPKVGAEHFEKLGALVSHFYEHHEKNADISFTDFLVLHYFDQSHQTAENHGDLPFFPSDDNHHHNHVSLGNWVFFQPSLNFFYENKGAVNQLSPKYSTQNQDLLFSQYCHSIWQPPRLA